MSVLQTIDLKKYYGTEPNITRALDGVNFSMEDGEFVAVVGTSGSGKSTLLHMMGGLDTPTSGNVIVRDKELSKMNDEHLTIFRRRNIVFIFQIYNLVPILNVYENSVLPVELDGAKVDQKVLDEIVHLLGLEDKLKNMPNNISDNPFTDSVVHIFHKRQNRGHGRNTSPHCTWHITKFCNAKENR